MTTGLWSTGSISTHVGTLVGWSNIPTGISGTVLDNIVEQEINFAEQYSSTTINSSTIPEKFQPPIIDLVLSKLLLTVDMNSGGINSANIGPLSVSAGASSNAELAKQLREDAIIRLKETQRTPRFKRVLG